MPTDVRRPTLADVARLAGVSTALASIVMRGVPGASEASRQRVSEAAGQLGYRPDLRARQLRRRRSGLVGVAFEMQQAFHGDLIEEIYAAADQVGLEVALSAVTPRRSEQRAVETLLDERCEGVILLGPRAPSGALDAIAREVPVVVVARSVRASSVDTVRTSDSAGMRLAVDHLVDLGHRDIGYVDGGTAPGAAARRRAYRESAARRDLNSAIVLAGSPSEDSGAEAARRLLALSPGPTAVIAFNDRCATGVLDVVLRAGLAVPQDVSLMGYDDSRLARLSHVNLTTIGQDPPALARAAVGRMVDRLEGRAVAPRELVTQPELVIRASTGPPVRAITARTPRGS